MQPIPQYPYKAYGNAAQTASPSVQVIMLYNAAINYIKQAKVAVQNDDHDTRCKLTSKTMSVMRGLRCCLDFSACEEVAIALDKYYSALDILLVELLCNPEENLCDTIVNNLITIRDQWVNVNLIICDSKENLAGSAIH